MSPQKKIGVLGLTTMVFGSMIGSGIFNIPQNIAVKSALGPVIIAWIITGIGMLSLAFVFKILTEEQPELNTGIYSYAKEGFGTFVGFNSAWGYWLTSITGNVAFAIMLNDSLGHYFPILLNHGIPTVLLGLALIWIYNFIITRGIQQASSLNTITVIIKFIAILAIICMYILYTHIDFKNIDLWGVKNHLGSIWSQIKSPMLVTVWCFIGIEGAVVVSNHARRKKDVGIATLIGFLVALILYVMVSILPYAIINQPQLAHLPDPSTAYVLDTLVGSWFTKFVTLSVLISIGGVWIAWTILMAQVPYAAALDGTFPKIFTKENKKMVPSTALTISSAMMSLFLIFALTAKDVYLESVNITSVIILPSYLLSAMYLCKIVLTKQIYAHNKIKLWMGLCIGLVATIYCGWLIYSTGLNYLFIASIFYAIGIIPFYIARKQQGLPLKQIFPPKDACLAIIILMLAILSSTMLITDKIIL